MHQFPKLGVLGGGQLGKMMAIAVAKWHFPIAFLDKSKSFPASFITHHFEEGDFSNYDDVYQFGQDKDVITIEIEHVNTEALLALQKEGKIIHPAPEKLNIIKDKGLQKNFYRENNIPTSKFSLFETKDQILAAIESGKINYPFVQKTRTAGYDGKGVQVIEHNGQKEDIFDVPSVIEQKIAIKKELAVIVARNPSGDIKSYPVVEMSFDPKANLVEFLACPAEIEAKLAAKATQLAINVAEAMDICGLLAVEQFLTEENEILINEVAPRPHNSGHHTIESCYTSQFEQHIRAVLDLPLGSCQLIQPAVMLNLLGHPAFKGLPYYEGLEKVMEEEGVNVHIYGKTETRPYRKMGHITIINNNLNEAKRIAKRIKEELIVISKG